MMIEVAKNKHSIQYPKSFSRSVNSEHAALHSFTQRLIYSTHVKCANGLKQPKVDQWWNRSGFSWLDLQAKIRISCLSTDLTTDPSTSLLNAFSTKKFCARLLYEFNQGRNQGGG